MATQRIVLITGATRGLGRAMVEEFVRLGHTVVGCGRSLASIKALQARFGEPHEFYAVDVASDTAVKSWASVVLTKFGPPDLLINNAGVINRTAPLWELDAREFDAVMHTNVRAVANLVRHFVPAMRARKSGVIVNFSSGWGRSVDAEVAPYCASKWAVEGLTRALAQELPSTMAAVPLNPGIVNTEMLQSCFGESAASYPLPEEWARTAVPFILNLSSRDSGNSLSVPSPP
jgi:NAD(P)-dependent dehydrogenase (short-subunit alcohol dehydrogenase family)